ncbi:MAG: GIY-YIG nuclease family protein [Clostridia bacterium]|nr:GIY-YIG nuclease family protein [Clostridia bacterium]
MKHAYVYIMTCESNSTLYIGVTNDLARRVYEHRNEVLDGFTKRYKLHKLVYFEEHNNIEDAIEREKVLKKWSRAKKNTLVERQNPQWQDLSLEWNVIPSETE